MVPVPVNEAARLAELRRLAIFGTPRQPHFDAVCRLACELFAVPIATIAFVEADRQWFKASCGVASEGSSREDAFCSYTIMSDAPFIVADAAADPRFAENALVVSEPHIRFYAGLPLSLRPDLRIGTLCLIDTVPRDFPPEQVARLRDLGEIVVAHLRLHESANAHAAELDAQRRVAEALALANRALAEREADLRATKDLLRNTIDRMDQGLVVLDAGQRIRVANARMADLLDLPPALLHEGAALAEIRRRQRARGDAAELPPGLCPVSEDGSEPQSPPVFDWPRPDGGVLEVRRSPLHDGGSVVVFSDVTQHRLAARAVQESERTFRLLAEHTTDIIIWSDLTTARRYVSPAVTTVLGYDPAALLGTRPLDFVHPGEADAYAGILGDLTAGRAERALTTQRYRHRDGHWVWLEISFRLTHDARTGRPDGYVASLRDISERRAMEEALRESDARYRALVEHQLRQAREHADFTATTSAAILGQLAEGVIVTDGDGRIILVNNAAAAIHGTSRLDVPPDAYSDTYHLFTEDGQPHPPEALPLARAVRGEVVRDACWLIRRPDGTEIRAVGNAQPLFGPADAQIGAVLTLRDDTARAAAEQSLRDLNATLSQHVAVRTREVEAARELAEAGSRAKSDFLAAMSHEIRTPLNGVIGYADLLQEEPGLSPAARLHADRIRSSGSALLTIVNDILDFSKIEAGRVEIQSEPFLVSGLVEGAFAIVRGSAEAKGLAVNVTVASEVPVWVSGDKARLRQVLLNLLNNAIKFTHRGWVDLSVASAPCPDGRVRLHFAVSDTGVGIPAGRRHRLFRRFSQADASISRDFGGTGLGLAISKSLVDLMAGSIGFESTEGQGSRFWFDVPLPIVPPDARSDEASAAPVIRTSHHLLLAEDVPLNQDLACLILRGAGHTVDVVGDGAEAVAAVRTNSYDLVLMDVQMPGVDGLTATRRIRALDGAAGRVPIVALTANVLPQQVAALHATGMDGHVGKPFRKDALLAAVERWALRRMAGTPRPSIDREVYEETSGLVGRERMRDMLAMLAEELGQRFGPASVAHHRERIAEDAHAMISATSMIGFSSLAETCREVEDACRSDGAYEHRFEALRARAAETIAEIEALRAA
ncbi:PAS domain S-box protein [Methylobacterium dankookense]|uniref:histidine kinase n=1 Tax=Methylobacterium dankookense TaxID=560405 RepID=A0A564FSH0_9HYPH|nr:PAS domain S-box protein [Methylobacterium dankookense]GJD54156.1 Sensor histidine kinase RcsC [Methylobacterium dankookense]VUF11115.1 Sensory/regulatory protein RpfC [Methylobacterium dankookense]